MADEDKPSASAASHNAPRAERPSAPPLQRLTKVALAEDIALSFQMERRSLPAKVERKDVPDPPSE